MADFIFGYDTLMSALGVNGRGLKRIYKPKHFRQAQLCSFRRLWNVVWDGKLFLGIISDKSANINGTIFEIDTRDIAPLCKSMMVGKTFRLVNVSTNIVVNPRISNGDRIFTFAPTNPSLNGFIPDHYSKVIYEILELHGQEFKREFVRTTEWNDEFMSRLLESKYTQLEHQG